MVGSPSGKKSYKISFKIKQNMELKEFAQMEQKLKGTQPKEENSAAIALVAAGYAGDMDEELVNVLLDDIDYHFNKVKCRKIEQMMPQLMKMVESEMVGMI